MTDNVTVTLKSCPGCGKDHTRVIGGPGTAGGPKYWAGCDYCHWRAWGDTEAEAITAWNTRTEAKAVEGDVEAETEKLIRSAYARGYYEGERAVEADLAALTKSQDKTAESLREGRDFLRYIPCECDSYHGHTCRRCAIARRIDDHLSQGESA